MTRWDLLLVVLACFGLGCGSDAMTGCTPGTTIACTCPDGTQSTQQCNSFGGFTNCRNCPVPSVHDAAVDVPPTGPCSVARDCATCTPLAGCGWCGATSSCVPVNAACTAPAEGACGAGWACQRTDCPDSTECRPCSTNADCVSGQCARRTCDGQPACVPLGRPAVCAVIGGVTCPAVAAYRACTDDAQCGPRMRCLAVWPGQSARVCTPPCAAHEDCPGLSMAGGVAVPFCATTTRTCALGCTREGTCDLGLLCRRDVTGNYAFCL